MDVPKTKNKTENTRDCELCPLDKDSGKGTLSDHNENICAHTSTDFTEGLFSFSGKQVLMSYFFNSDACNVCA